MHQGIILALLLTLAAGCGARNETSREAGENRTNSAAAPNSNAGSDSETANVLRELTQTVRRYAAEQQKAPKSLDEIVSAHYLPAIPQAPPGKKFAINKNLEVYLADQ